MIHYDMAHSEVAYIYLLKAFNRKTNKKEYKSQILEYNIYHTNVIVIQDFILLVKVPVGSVKKKGLLIICLMQRLRGYTVQQMFC